jgi:hypothetical protein
MISVCYKVSELNIEKRFYNIEDAIKFSYVLWKDRIEYKYKYDGVELIEYNSWDFIEIEKCLAVQIELIDKINKEFNNCKE